MRVPHGLPDQAAFVICCDTTVTRGLATAGLIRIGRNRICHKPLHLRRALDL
jgi:hypothetical protein